VLLRLRWLVELAAMDARVTAAMAALMEDERARSYGDALERVLAAAGL